MELSGTHGQWAKSVYDKIIAKELTAAMRSGEIIPYTADKSGRFIDRYAENPGWWTNSFWTGMLWLLYQETGETRLSELAARLEAKLDVVLQDSEKTDHDAGFLWHLSSVANGRITGNPESKRRGLTAAKYLLSRFNAAGGFITAWNKKEREGWSIIDTMMNLPLLYWAWKETGMDRYKRAAVLHADKTMENAVRSDGSVIHVIEYSIDDGSVICSHAGQGYAVGSSWTRGQAWAIYGFILSYLHTGEARYLDTAKRTAHYFLAAAAVNGYVPPVDFRAPAEPVYHDATAGAIAACGLIELSRALKDSEAAMYLEGAVKLLKALDAGHADYGPESDALLHNGSEGWPPRGVHMDIIYGDYFYMEAFCMLCGKYLNMW
jgi:unsaturated chondroitin disaccharide hydrolase